MTETQRKFALHGAYVISQNDGDRHWIPGYRLIDLYELRRGEFILWGRPYAGWNNYRHLYPRSDGRYGRPRDE